MTDPQFWWYLARAGGLVAWALLSTTVVWGLLLRSGLLGRWIPWAWTAAVHRFLGMLAVLFTALHLTGLLLDDYVQMSLPDLLVPLTSSWRPVPVALGVVAGYLLVAVLGTSLLAARLSRRWWKRVHLTSYLLFWSATMHLVTAGTDAGNAVVRAVVAATVTVVLLLTLVRIARCARWARAGRPAAPVPALPAAAAPTYHPLRVAEVRRETPDAVSVRFAVPPALAPGFRFRPGQHVLLRARIGGTVVTRPYSVCSGVADGELRIAVRQLPGGRMSTWVNTALRAGDTLDVAPPAGTFATEVRGRSARHVLGVAAGSGITPVISIMSSVLAAEPGSRCTLVYGNRTAAGTLFAARLAALQERHPGRLRVVHLRSQEAASPPVLPGRIDRHVLRTLADRGDLAGVDEAYVCGPEGMACEVQRALVGDLGLSPRQVRTEVFSTTRPTPPSGSDAGEATVRIRHRGAEHTVPVATGESILDAGLRAGLDLPHSCRAGVCGTCRATLLSRTAGDGDWATEALLTCRGTAADGATVDFDAVDSDAVDSDAVDFDAVDFDAVDFDAVAVPDRPPRPAGGRRTGQVTTSAP
ncbi:FAD-binding oxidoreductase [Geodermatophilus sp. SYSU D00758]